MNCPECEKPMTKEPSEKSIFECVNCNITYEGDNNRYVYAELSEKQIAEAQKRMSE